MKVWFLSNKLYIHFYAIPNNFYYYHVASFQNLTYPNIHVIFLHSHDTSFGFSVLYLNLFYVSICIGLLSFPWEETFGTDFFGLGLDFYAALPVCEFCLLTVIEQGFDTFAMTWDGSIEDLTVDAWLLIGCVFIRALLPSLRLAS